MNYKYITIEGNIGAGKTTLTQLLQKESFKQNLYWSNLLIILSFQNFIRIETNYSFPLELSFLADRYKQLKNMLSNRDLFSEYIFSDYLFIKSKLFAKVNLAEDEYKLYARGNTNAITTVSKTPGALGSGIFAV
jgi:deoxyguanosine kinase